MMSLPGRRGDGVEAAGIERMAAREAERGEPRSRQDAVSRKSFVSVIAAARIKAAGARQERTRREAVEIQ